MESTHSSRFTYNIVRPYPYRWFTPLVIIGGISATVFFSIINLSANGYVLKTIYTSNPNGTLENVQWFQKTPWSWGNKLSATCQAQELTVGTAFFTTNLGLTYTVANVWREFGDGSVENYAALTYLNNTLEDCKVTDIDIEMQRADTSSYSGDWWSWQNSKASATTTCVVNSDSSPVYVKITVDIASPPGNLPLVRVDNQTSASLFVGAKLMNFYLQSVYAKMSTLGAVNTSSGEYMGIFDSGTISLQPSTPTSFHSLDFFNFTFAFRTSSGILDFSGTWDWMPLGWWHEQALGPELSLQVNGFAKSLYSTILTDLGQTTDTNTLTNLDLLNYLFQLKEDIPLEDYGQLSLVPFPINTTYEDWKPSIGLLEVIPASVFAQYACSEPERKGTFSLLISIIVADLVLLQAFWKLLTFTTTRLINHKDPDANFCEGCMGRIEAQRYLLMKSDMLEKSRTMSMTGTLPASSADRLYEPVPYSDTSPVYKISRKPVSLGYREE